MVSEAVVVKGAAAATEKIASKLLELGVGPIATALAKWKNKRNRVGLARAVSHVALVKTLLHVDTEIDLTEFYFPSRVEWDGKPRVLNQLRELGERRNYVFQGTVGQGKSIFLRYLAIQELRFGGRLPLFFELRRVSLYGSIRAGVCALLKSYGFEINDHLFEFYASSSYFVLFLDGFDELAEDAVPKIFNEIEEISRQFPSLQLIVSSRPNGGIEASPQFRTIRLAPLTPADHRPFFKRVLNDEEQIDLLMSAIAKSPQDIKQLLMTPLTLALLVLVYRSENDIPATLAGFYDHLFWAILGRHEKAKLGGTRKRKSGLGDRELEELFQAICFASKMKGARSFSATSFYEFAKVACSYTKLECTPSHILEDLTKHVCLLTQDGLEYKFIHQSIQEFFAASFVKASNEEFAKKFYARMSETNRWRGWEQELGFLIEIDKYRYLKLFYVPLCTRFLSALPPDRKPAWSDLQPLLAPMRFYARQMPGNGIQTYVNIGDATYIESNFRFGLFGRPAMTPLFTRFTEDLIDRHRQSPGLLADGKVYSEDLPSVVNRYGMQEMMEKDASAALEDISARVARAIAAIAREEQKILMID